MSVKFAALAAKVQPAQLAGWITQHNPKVRARAEATRKKRFSALAGKAKSTK